MEKLISILIGVFLLCVIIFSSCAIVPPGHRGVGVTLGKVSSSLRGEGLNFKWPFIQKIVKIPIQQITVTGQTECFSSDLQLLEVNYSVLYKLPPEKVIELYQLYQGDPYTTLVEKRLWNDMKQITALYRAEDAVKKREEMKAKILELISRNVQGMVIIVDVPLNDIGLSKDLEQAIEAKQVQEQQALQKTYELQKAQKQAEITVVNAEAQAKAVKIKGEALKANPEIIQLEIAQKWNGIAPTTVVTSGGGANILLPLK